MHTSTTKYEVQLSGKVQLLILYNQLVILYLIRHLQHWAANKKYTLITQLTQVKIRVF